MGKYDNVTMKEYMKKKLEILNDLGRKRKNELCNGVSCNDCPLSHINNNLNVDDCGTLELLYPERALEIVMDYEPKIDWTKVPVDAKVLVKDYKEEDWKKRHFAKYEGGKIYAYDDGKSSFTANGVLASWSYGKLYKEGE